MNVKGKEAMKDSGERKEGPGVKVGYIGPGDREIWLTENTGVEITKRSLTGMWWGEEGGPGKTGPKWGER